MWQNAQTWFQANVPFIIFVLISAYLIARYSGVPIAGFVRRTIKYRAHGDSSPEDIKKRQDTIISMLTTLVRFAVWLTAVFTILGRFGIDVTPLLAGASVLGVAVGFGAQSLIKDFLSGLFIILENQYRVGDVVELDGASGTVEHVSIRTTIVRDNDGSVHYIPNGLVQHSINKTMGYSKINFTISVAPGTDIDKLSDIINEVGAKLNDDEKWGKKILEAPRFLSIGNFSSAGLEVKIIGKTKPSSQWSVSGELRKRLLSAFKKHGIELSPSAPAPAPKKK